jgi:hypothetical protein
MPINADKPHLWLIDIQASVDLFNAWFMKFAPKAYRDTRVKTTKHVEKALLLSNDLTSITPETLKGNPEILPSLRMSTCPPLARDRLIGLAGVSKPLVNSLEEGKIPLRMSPPMLEKNLEKIGIILTRMLDAEIFPWLATKKAPSKAERHRASTIVADRLCSAVSDPIIRNTHEKRQLVLLEAYLKGRGYVQRAHPSNKPLTQMQEGTFAFRMNVVVGDVLKVNIPVDVVIQPKIPRRTRLPILIEAKSAGDFTNVNKRRKEEATKMHQLRNTYGNDIEFLLFLCGYFDSGYLGYEAAEGIDWVWEHRIEDLDKLGL